ncbi:MAG: sensor histidine kinase KdpD [Candidatus Sumerlaeia bacterium]|nr:sensor histidine kinase KdpD [Candidatus Sumerlaeia bacterium]
MSEHDPSRPDPDALLARISAEESRAHRGRLQVYLGMCPGVGKTFAMLESAQEDRRAGRAPLVGIVETHRRAETEALLHGLDVLPRRTVEHRGVTLTEFDLDAALAAKPPVVLVDEFAHTNAPGSRHGKRWQDVRELLNAGIDVRTTLNIQHVESLNDVVAQITGVRMRETVPDSVLDEADEVVLVDLPPEELRERLEAGKVYLGEQAARAADGFFRPANLTALRELALRFVAGRVGRQVRFHREAAGSAAIWPTQERVLVAVGPAPSSATLVRAAKRLAAMLGAEWFAISVETPRALDAAGRERVMAHLRLAESLGARTATAAADTVPEGILDFARRENVTKLVVGKPVLPRWRQLLRPSPVDELVRNSGDIDVYVIRGDAEAGAGAVPAAPGRPIPRKRSWMFVPVVGVALTVVVAKALDPVIELPDVAMIFVLAGACVALLGSRRAALLMAVLSFFCFNFFFVPPLHTLYVAGTEYLITFAVLFLVTAILGELTVRLRERQLLAKRSAERTAAVYRLSTLLAQRRGRDALARAAAAELSKDLAAPVALSLRASEGTPVHFGAALGDKEHAVVNWVLDNRLPAGRGTSTLASSTMLHLPLAGPRGIVGVASIGGDPLGPEETELLHALLRHVALVLSVEALEEQHRIVAREAETERLRNSILSAVSHDLRTPLASILGSASSLQEQGELLSEVTRRELLGTITEEADRLNRLIANLLEMTRIEGGALRLELVPLPVEELVGTSLHAMRRAMAGRSVRTSVPPSLPFVLADELLLQQVLVNLLENACKHTPAGTAIHLSAEQAGEVVILTVGDEGPGLPDVPSEQLFERFYRGDRVGTGVGLGLAICKSIVAAHGGRIDARNRPDGGAEFRFTLPAASGADVPSGEEA